MRGRRGPSIDLFSCKIHIHMIWCSPVANYAVPTDVFVAPRCLRRIPQPQTGGSPIRRALEWPVRQAIRATVREAMPRGRIGASHYPKPRSMQGLDAPSWTHRGEMPINSSEKLSRPFRPPYGEMPLDTLALARPRSRRIPVGLINTDTDYFRFWVNGQQQVDHVHSTPYGVQERRVDEVTSELGATLPLPAQSRCGSEMITEQDCVRSKARDPTAGAHLAILCSFVVCLPYYERGCWEKVGEKVPSEHEQCSQPLPMISASNTGKRFE